MAEKPDIPLEKALISFYEGDVDTLKQFYPRPIGYNLAVRTIVHEHCKVLRERASREAKVIHERLELVDLTSLGLDPSARGSGNPA